MADTTRIPIDLNTPRFTDLAGNCFWNAVNLATADVDYGWWEFVLDVEGKLYGKVTIPNTIGGSPAAKIILVIAANATTGDTRLQVSTLPVANGESLNQALTAETAQDVTVENVAYETKEVSFTLTNAPVAKDVLVVEVFHDGDHANDTLAVNTLLLEAYLEIDLS